MKTYLKTFENNIIIFGNLFSDIHIRRENSDGTKQKDIKVPLVYASKEKMFNMINNRLAKPDTKKVQEVYPLMGFSLTGFSYDNIRKTNSNIYLSYTDTESNTEVELNKIPYNLNFDLTIASIHQYDLYAILEQILVWFKPFITIKTKLNPSIGETASDINIFLTSQRYEDTNQNGQLEEGSTSPYINTISFTAKTWLWCTNDTSGTGIPNSINQVQLGIWDWNYDYSPIIKDENYPIIIE